MAWPRLRQVRGQNVFTASLSLSLFPLAEVIKMDPGAMKWGLIVDSPAVFCSLRRPLDMKGRPNPIDLGLLLRLHTSGNVRILRTELDTLEYGRMAYGVWSVEYGLLRMKYSIPVLYRTKTRPLRVTG